MSGFREYTVSQKAVEQGMALGLGLRENVEITLKAMARTAAVCTHAQGNRRYGAFVLRVQNDIVEGVSRF